MRQSIVALGIFMVLFARGEASAEQRTKNVILFTLDGVRRQEIFGGLDLEVLESFLQELAKKGKRKADEPLEESPLYKEYWAPTAEERRQKLMPFFWGTLMKEYGSIAGNHGRGSVALIKNPYRISYPGYAEMLVGEARQDIKLNDPKRVPVPTVLEFLTEELRLSKHEVAAFASWEPLKVIVEQRCGTLTTNAGRRDRIDLRPDLTALSDVQFEMLVPWDHARADPFTFRFAMTHMQMFRPRVVFLQFDETDGWAHEGRYDHTLEAIKRADGYLRSLWMAVEASEQYRGKTTLIVTTDHGRGDTPADWKTHGENVEGAQYVWIAVVSPDSRRRGEWSGGGEVYLNQVAATLGRAVGLDYLRQNPRAGKPLPVFED